MYSFSHSIAIYRIVSSYLQIRLPCSVESRRHQENGNTRSTTLPLPVSTILSA